MKLNYDNNTDSLYINFNDKPGVDSFEVSKDFIVDIDSDGQVVGLEILNIKNKVDLDSVIFDSFPVKDIKFVGQENS